MDELNTNVSDSEITLDTVVTEDAVIDTTVSNDEVSVTTVSTEKTPGKRGRKPSLLVAARRQEAIDTASEILISGAGEQFTVSQLVRKCEAKGLNHSALWTDVYHFLMAGNHNFEQTGGNGTRTKWFVKPAPVTVEEILQLIGVE